MWFMGGCQIVCFLPIEGNGSFRITEKSKQLTKAISLSNGFAALLVNTVEACPSMGDQKEFLKTI